MQGRRPKLGLAKKLNQAHGTAEQRGDSPTLNNDSQCQALPH
jgi:hypothetical protein